MWLNVRNAKHGAIIAAMGITKSFDLLFYYYYYLFFLLVVLSNCRFPWKTYDSDQFSWKRLTVDYFELNTFSPQEEAKSPNLYVPRSPLLIYVVNIWYSDNCIAYWNFHCFTMRVSYMVVVFSFVHTQKSILRALLLTVFVVIVLTINKIFPTRETFNGILLSDYGHYSTGNNPPLLADHMNADRARSETAVSLNLNVTPSCPPPCKTSSTAQFNRLNLTIEVNAGPGKLGKEGDNQTDNRRDQKIYIPDKLLKRLRPKVRKLKQITV